MRPTDLGLFRTPGAPTLSPDGAVAVVAVSRPDLAADAYASQLWWIDTAGSAEPRPLTYGSKDSAPAFSPDGRWLAFLRAVEDKPQVHVLAVHGGEPRCLTTHPLGASGPVWAPDSGRLAYVARVPEPGRYGTVEGVGPDKEPPRLITELAYRVDDVGFTRDRRKQVFVVTVSDDEPQPSQLTHFDADHTEPAWSPDGSLLACVAARHDGRERDLATDVVLVPLDGSEPRTLTGSRQSISSVGFAVDGATVWFLGSGDLGADGLDFVANQEGLWSVSLDGSAAPTRHSDPEADDFSETVGGLTVTAAGVLVGRLNRGAVELVRLPAAGAEWEPVLTGHRQVHGHAVAGDVLVATVADPTTLGEVLVLRDGTETVLTSYGTALTGAVIRPLEELTATSPDGYPVHGWVVRPDGDGPHPVILSVHGGPFAQYGWGLFDEAQVYAAAGYAVVLCNPRGRRGTARHTAGRSARTWATSTPPMSSPSSTPPWLRRTSTATGSG